MALFQDEADVCTNPKVGEHPWYLAEFFEGVPVMAQQLLGLEALPVELGGDDRLAAVRT